MSKTIGLLHPGQMGITLAASIQNSGHQVLWCSAGRSEKTLERADSEQLQSVPTLEELCQRVDILFCVCPPHAALDVLTQVITAGYQGTYVDANAISPRRTKELAKVAQAQGLHYVDGGIVGGPARKRGTTWLYLSGEGAEEVAALVKAGPMEVQVLEEGIGAASGMKMCFASYTKGTTALLSAILATSEQLGVREVLMEQWRRYGWDLPEEAERRATRVTAKSWRFAGEMNEIAQTFDDAGVPDGFYKAAEEVYQRTAHFKHAEETPALSEVLDSLLQQDKS